MLALRVLNSKATLNDYDVIGSLQFIPNSTVTLVVQLFDTQRQDELRYVADAGATLTLNLLQNDGTETPVTATAFSDDRSIWSAELPATLTENLQGGNLNFTLVEGAQETLGFAENVLSRIISGVC